MSQKYDVISVGAGHHGLIVAAYMAKAGKSVLVLERNDHPGGGCVTKELAPGYFYDEHSTIHQVILSNPMIKNDELGLLSQFGLEYIFPEAVFSSVFDDGSVLTSYRSVEKSVEAIAQFSKADGRRDRFAARDDTFTQLQQLDWPVLLAGLGALFEAPTGAIVTDPPRPASWS